MEPPGLFEQRQQKRYLLRALQQLAKAALQQDVLRYFKRDAKAGREWDWHRILEWSAIASSTQDPALSPAAMSANGIDVILEMPERLSRQLVVTSQSRKLKTRGVLAAFGTVPLPIESETAISSPTGIESLLSASELPKAVTILGDSAEAAMWAEVLCALGSQVRLVSEQFLRYEDWDVKRLVRSQLIASGVKIISPSKFLQNETPIACYFLAEVSLRWLSLTLYITQPVRKIGSRAKPI